ncbi:hypothetical protein [Helicobacter saguini]|nr:hypothetical protein [Helicobacter saguini]
MFFRLAAKVAVVRFTLILKKGGRVGIDYNKSCNCDFCVLDSIF